MSHYGRITLWRQTVEAEKRHCGEAWAGLEDVLRRTAAAVRGQAARKHLALRVSMPPDLPCVRTDAGQLLQLFAALFSAAIENTPDQGQVSLDVERGSGCAIVLSLAGTGKDVSREEIAAAVGRFARSRSFEIDDASGTEACITLRWSRESWLSNPREMVLAPGFR
jgi:signal transduction histidine kinase